MLVYGGMKFSKNYQNGDRISWKCNKAACIARVNTVGNQLVFTRNYHNHNDSISSALKFEMTKFGNPTISWGNYRFIKKLTRRMKTWWECTARKSSGCRCVAVTVENRLMKLNGWHNH
ncbi:unnamed protein product, partial [Iphiclides podalirius]